MIEKIEVTVGKNKIKVTKGTTLEELARNYQDGIKYRIILGKVNGQIRELSYHLIDDAEVEFFPTNKKLVRVVNGTLIAQMEGSTDILIQLKDFP